MDLIYQAQSKYNLIRVFKEEEELWLRLGGGTEIHSLFRPGECLLKPIGEYYWNFFNVLPLLKKDSKRILIVGLGCGTLSRQLGYFFPELEIEGVEIDEKVIEVGIRYFELTQPNLIVHICDGIEFLKKDTLKYDLIVLDAFTKGNINTAFLNEEMFKMIKNKLVADGIFSLNYLNETHIAKKIKQNILPLFKNIMQVPVKGCYNFVMFASDIKYDLKKIETDDEELKKVVEYVNSEYKMLKDA